MTVPEHINLEGGLRLERADPRHVDAVAEAVLASPEIVRWQGWADGYSRKVAATWVSQRWLSWEAEEGYAFVVLEGDRLVGSVGLDEFRMGGAEANLGYWTRDDAAGRGIATAAARAVARLAFEHAGLRRLRLFHSVGHIGSRRVAQKVGFVEEGVLRAYAPLQGEPADVVLYSLVDPSEIR